MDVVLFVANRFDRTHDAFYVSCMRIAGVE